MEQLLLHYKCDVIPHKRSCLEFTPPHIGSPVSPEPVSRNKSPIARACVYKTSAGRSGWLNRDPIGELGGINLYKSFANNPIKWIDAWGLDLSKTACNCKDLCNMQKSLGKAADDLNSIRNPKDLNDIFNKLQKMGDYPVGENNGLWSGGIKGRGVNMGNGEQHIVNYFESREFTNKDGGNDILGVNSHGDGPDYASAWQDAEANRLANALSELAKEIAKRGCICQ